MGKMRDITGYIQRGKQKQLPDDYNDSKNGNKHDSMQVKVSFPFRWRGGCVSAQEQNFEI